MVLKSCCEIKGKIYDGTFISLRYKVMVFIIVLIKTILIDEDNGTIEYKMSEKQAKTVEEVLLGVMFIILEIKRIGLDLKLLCNEGVDFIRNWESEKYRASLVK